MAPLTSLTVPDKALTRLSRLLTVRINLRLQQSPTEVREAVVDEVNEATAVTGEAEAPTEVLPVEASKVKEAPDTHQIPQIAVVIGITDTEPVLFIVFSL